MQWTWPESPTRTRPSLRTRLGRCESAFTCCIGFGESSHDCPPRHRNYHHHLGLHGVVWALSLQGGAGMKRESKCPQCGAARMLSTKHVPGARTIARQDATRCRRCSQIEHGHTHKCRPSPTHSSWRSMIRRCSEPKNKDWAEYGGRGIKVCERWLDFETFLADMGSRPDGTSLDRIDNNGNYEPGNCRWATIIEQARNRRTNKIVEWNGIALGLCEWSVRLNIRSRTINARLTRGWSVERALTTPTLNTPGSRRGITGRKRALDANG
jgi:hypothetical protein